MGMQKERYANPQSRNRLSNRKAPAQESMLREHGIRRVDQMVLFGQNRPPNIRERNLKRANREGGSQKTA
jgi:hypothetical protein